MTPRWRRFREMRMDRRLSELILEDLTLPLPALGLLTLVRFICGFSGVGGGGSGRPSADVSAEGGGVGEGGGDGELLGSSESSSPVSGGRGGGPSVAGRVGKSSLSCGDAGGCGGALECPVVIFWNKYERRLSPVGRGLMAGASGRAGGKRDGAAGKSKASSTGSAALDVWEKDLAGEDALEAAVDAASVRSSASKLFAEARYTCCSLALV